MKRELKGNWARAVTFIALAFTFFHLYTGAMGVLPHMQQRAIHVIFGFVLIFALNSPRKGKAETRIPVYDIAIMVATVVFCLNTFFRYEYYLTTRGMSSTLTDFILGTIAMLVVIEAGRRTTGWVFPSLTVAIIGYAFFGQHIPGLFGHPGFNYDEVITCIYRYDSGIWGFITGVSAALISMFIIFGAVLQYTGGGATFMELATVAAGRYRGGPAIVAVMASALFGTCSGSAVANVATTGNFTIPMMEKLGYPSRFAGAVETTASTGGQIMPPIMASGAFIMAELLGIAYIKVCIAALIPAILYFLAVFTHVRFEAVKQNLPPMAREDIPRVKAVLTWGKLAPLFIPLATLIYFLVIGYSPYTAAFYTVVMAMLIYFFADFRLSGMKQRLINIKLALERAGKTLTDIVAIVACANVFVGLLFLTGLSGKITGVIIDIGGQNVLLALMLAAIIALILGMGMPSVAAYILAISVVGPALKMMGLPDLNVHMFVFYFAILSAITPPVCVAAFTAALIAHATWFDIAKTAMKIAILIYFLPFLFIYRPEFLMQGTAGNIAIATITAIIGVTCVASGIVGYLTAKLPIISRIMLPAGGILLFIPGWTTDLTGVALIVGGILVWRFLPKVRALYFPSAGQEW